MSYRDDFLVDLDGVGALAVGVVEGDHLEHAHAEGVDVDEVVVVLAVDLGGHELRGANTVGMGEGGVAEDGGEAKVADLDLAGVAVDEDVVALEVAVDYGGIVAVEVGEGAEDLAAPGLESAEADTGVALAVPNFIYVNSIDSIQYVN